MKVQLYTIKAMDECLQIVRNASKKSKLKSYVGTNAKGQTTLKGYAAKEWELLTRSYYIITKEYNINNRTSVVLLSEVNKLLIVPKEFIQESKNKNAWLEGLGRFDATLSFLKRHAIDAEITSSISKDCTENIHITLTNKDFNAANSYDRGIIGVLLGLGWSYEQPGGRFNLSIN